MPDLKFNVEMSELRQHVNFVRNGLGMSKTDLQVMLFRFDVQGNKCNLFSANKEMFCRTQMKIKKEEEDQNGSFSVLGGKIERLISQVESEQVSFKADNENLEVESGFLTVNFELYDGATLRSVEAGTIDHLKEEGMVVPKGALEEALSCAKSCTTTSSIRPDVTHAELRGGRMLSSDGRKIMIYSHDGFEDGLKFKCPATSINACLAAVKNIEAETVEVVDGSSYYFVKAALNEYTFGIRKIERDFPAVEGQISTAEEPEDEISVDSNVLEAMLRGVALGLPTDEVRVTMEAGGTGEEAYLEVSSRSSIDRRSHERASCGRKSDKAISFPLSFKHLLDTLSVFQGDSVVDMMVMSTKNLLMVRDVTEVREVFTIIPFRTDSQIEDEKKEKEAQAEAVRKAKEAAEGNDEEEDAGELTDSAIDDDDLELEEASAE